MNEVQKRLRAAAFLANVRASLSYTDYWSGYNVHENRWNSDEYVTARYADPRTRRMGYDDGTQYMNGRLEEG